MSNEFALRFEKATGFSPFELPHDLDWGEHEDYSAWLDRLGYKAVVWMMGDEGAPAEARCFRSELANVPRYYFDVRSGENTTTVFASTDADSFHCRMALATMIHAEISADWMIQTLSIGERAFRAAHGHSVDAVCRACDPDEVEMRERERARLRHLASEKRA